MAVVTDILSGLLMAWFSLLFIGINRFCGRVKWKDRDAWQYILLECMLILYFIGSLKRWYFVIPIMAFLFPVWDFLQFRAHWLSWITGASDERLRRYDDAFGDNVYLLPKSDRRTVPDAYHTVQHVLMALNTIAVFAMLR
ncbi:MULTISPECIES: hypothetical protein [Alicyclobacillus]|uniref:Uncharacterized protein n=1 Tax=Alicyclobacillus acidocaldarius subsp. acidocaldarius (strain ATCC 27009 / DSM 446 / BCRC 14685 / JCM 5260 / KCTC 1825 / NBRC 15652 / NCIMB 11725 / NRRL B-14509 / 104-IA) TaxID=521098 RepID=C8WPZ8_ALIAD|nr:MULTISPECIES: hypothetical protein [Alicyclobacillus]ACV57102.1 hypothetical protein Aaci_0038 [Alicyclobacillus acidocaldarius subsp. acidocaldarius DSM 446]